MTVTAAQLLVKVNADTSNAQNGLSGLLNMMSGVKGGLVAGSLLAGAAIVGIGVASTKMAADFQSGMTSLVTGAGESSKNLKLVSDGILQLADSTGTSTQQLISGMYQIESAGYRGKAGLDVLKAAAEGAKVGNADLGVVADATTTLMTDFGTQTHGASGAVNALIATTASGKTHMQDLASSLSQVAPTAAAARAKLTDMLGALATMTGEGVPAANAATYLRQTILALDAPSAAAQKAFASVGLTSAQVATEMQTSLPGALKMITDAVGKKFPAGSAAYVQALKDISGGSKTMQGMLDLTGNHLQTFQGNVAGVSGAMQKGGNSINGWSLVQGTFNQKMDRAREVVETLMIKLGTGLLPVIGTLVGDFATYFPPAIDATVSGFNKVVSVGAGVVHFFQTTPPAMDALKFTLLTLGGTILAFAASSIPALITALATSIPLWLGEAAAAGAAAITTLAAAAPFIAIGAAIALVAVGIYELITHWSQVSAFFKQLGADILGFLTNVWNHITSTVASWGKAFQNGVKFIQNLVKAGFSEIVTIIETPIDDVVALFEWLYQHNTYFADLVNAIKADLTDGKQFITTVWSDIEGLFTDAGNFIKRVAQADWGLVETYIIQPVQRAQTAVQGVITGVENDLSQAWEIVSGDAQAGWNRFTGFISSAIGTVKTDVNSIISTITTPIDNLGQTLLNSGENLIKMFIKGIENEAGAVGGAAQGIAKNVESMLGFHSPTREGPGATADQWMPALGTMLIAGLNAVAPNAGTAASKVAGAIAGSLKGMVAAPTVAGTSPAISGLPAGMTPAYGVANATMNGQPIQVTVNMDGKKVAQIVSQHQPSVVRQSTGTRSF